MLPPWARQKRERRAKFERDTVLHGLEEKIPCQERDREPDRYIYGRWMDTCFRVKRLETDTPEESWRAQKALYDMTGTTCPADAYSVVQAWSPKDCAYGPYCWVGRPSIDPWPNFCGESHLPRPQLRLL